MLLTVFIKTCNGNVDDFTLLRSPTRRASIANRLQIARDVFKKFFCKRPEHIALHWDGKLTTDKPMAEHLLMQPIRDEFRRGIPVLLKTIDSSSDLVDLIRPVCWFAYFRSFILRHQLVAPVSRSMGAIQFICGN